ncbi:bifunctional DNA-formamidopyrimidine glycosylase/DNA-(apurinic or apyrimidinic site) lyase [Magnetovirga frankeli]|uniref:bifunctional DNA-formamidopyrimidine glycosylase/DNA-(apurinic or apyrimidinic site) lyase n=1 Tax=Magnetovirga frankeli TaxID=947516 RepID=UPI001293C56B|nr:bifunctional DNA-formamidopyrimidine glycosylase/DNA-(apurinic or apyrimidinic site) lyase [gamma proteobacterium SS-5]
MPELPEVETSRRGIAPLIEGLLVSAVRVRQPLLRWPVSPELEQELVGQRILEVARRGKYLLLHTASGCLILHLGMSGSLRVLPTDTPAGKHDHLDVCLGERCLRLHDPRRFGAALWSSEPLRHPLLAGLGPEPLSDAFTAEYLQARLKGRSAAIKTLLMDSRLVVGVGNIYANEALFAAGIHPNRAGGRIGKARLQRLSLEVKQVLQRAIDQGGTTLRDFSRVDGRPGYFAQELKVYGRAGQPCPGCGQGIRQIRLGQRSSYYCPHCQH